MFYEGILFNCYKNPNYKQFKKALNSAKNQVNQIVIVDDFSQNNVIKKVIKENFQESYDYDILILRNKSTIGLTESLIKGIKFCKYDLIARLDDDDYWMPGKIDIQKNIFENNTNVVLCGTSSGIFYKDKVKKKIINFDNYKKELLIYNPFAHSSVLIRKSAYFLSGGYDPKFKTCQDYDLWTRLSKVGTIAYIQNVLTIIRFQERFKLKDFKKLHSQFLSSLIIKIKFSKSCGKLAFVLPYGILYSFKILILNYLLLIKELFKEFIIKKINL